MSIATKSPPHVALLPCAGMGHLLPFLRLASMLASGGCKVTIITPQPTVSAAESDQLSAFFSIHHHIKQLKFELLPFKKSSFINEDPFFIQMESIMNSVHLLRPILSSLSSPLSAIVADFPVASSIISLASDLSIPTYISVPTSARFFCLMSHIPHVAHNENLTSNANSIELPGLGPLAVSNIPPPMLNPNHFMAANVRSSVLSLPKAKGLLINTFNWFESAAIEALRSSVPCPVLPVGPLESFENEQARAHNLPWLDEQAPDSVVFVSFGNRLALSKDQIRELGDGLEKSGCKFLWVLKAMIVDKDDKEKVDDILGESFLERTKKQGMVVKGWVNQEAILAHPAIGGFVSHCGWNSVIEAARLGVPLLAWPQLGDTRVNAEAAEKAGLGLGLWIKDWDWGKEQLVDGNEIAEKIRKLMLSENLRARAKEVMDKAREARETRGTSESSLRGLIDSLGSNEEN